MQEVFEKIIEEFTNIRRVVKNYDDLECNRAVYKCMEIVKQAAAEYSNGWISCSEKMPPVETEVFILAKRKYKGGDCKYIRTTAMYEDGTVSENDSCWRWEDIEGEWDEENDCYIIPEGWWENRHYNTDEVYNNVVDDEVVAWQPMPAEYQRNGETRKKTNFDRCCESMEAMAQIIDIAKTGWTKEKIMEWLQKEVFEIPEPSSGDLEGDYKTNADRIRSMSDEELAKFIAGLSEHCLAGIGACDCSCVNTHPCYEVCEEIARKWLQSEVEE